MAVSESAQSLDPRLKRLFFGLGLSSVGSGLTMPLFIVYLSTVRGFPSATAGLVLAYLSTLSLFFAPLVGSLVDRFGSRVVMSFGLTVMAIAVACIGLISTVPQAFIVASVMAIGQSATWSPAAALVSRLAPQEVRQRAFGIQFLILNLGLGIGGLVSALMASTSNLASFQLLYLLDGVTFLCYLAVLLTIKGISGAQPREDEEERSTEGYRRVLSDKRLRRYLLIAIILLTCGYGANEVGLPLIITRTAHLEVGWVGIAYAANTSMIVVSQLFVLKLIHGRSRTRLMSLVGVIWAGSWLLIGATALLPMPLSIIGISLGSAIFAIGETVWSPIGSALLNDIAPQHLRGRYNALGSVSWGISGSLGPAVTGLLLGASLVGVWFALIAGGCLVAGLIAIPLRRTLTAEQDGRVSSGAV